MTDELYQPRLGGRWIRDSKTGERRRADEAPAAAEPPSPEAEADAAVPADQAPEKPARKGK